MRLLGGLPIVGDLFGGTWHGVLFSYSHILKLAIDNHNSNHSITTNDSKLLVDLFGWSLRDAIWVVSQGCYLGGPAGMLFGWSTRDAIWVGHCINLSKWAIQRLTGEL